MSAKNNFHDLWDTSAEYYSTFNDTYYPTRLKFELLRKYSEPSFNCLDIGIANGIFSIPFSTLVNSIDGIDISEKMLEKCKSEMDRVSINNIFLHNKSAEELPFENEKFDMIFSFATLGVIPKIDRTYHEINRTLKQGGVAILDFIGEKNLASLHWGKYYRSIGHFGINCYSLKQLKENMNRLGFEIIETHSIGVMDQWKYIPGLHKLTFLEDIFHSKNSHPDLDYRITKVFPTFANHWFVVLKKI
jgi:ubiquinone/menaquinone biosynthesis C-methylase UbiE